MPSRSLHTWLGATQKKLDELEHVHVMVGGHGPGRRVTTQQVNQAYAVFLASQFQGFCRDLHSEASNQIADAALPPSLRSLMRALLINGRKLDMGNPNPGNLGSDFGRFGMALWDQVKVNDKRNEVRRKDLEKLLAWRHAIAHQDFDRTKLSGKKSLTLGDVRKWRSACTALAQQFDLVLEIHLRTILGKNPW